MRDKLVIVESPAKCKKIESFLGPGFKCVASFGHLRELSSLKDIDIKNNFHPTFSVSDKKRKYISNLKKEISKADEVILATDDDREGEAIAWHICMLFDLNVTLTKRIIFHEITEHAVQEAMKNPTIVNMDVVHAQQTRQILDLVLGFKISPVLWKHIAHKSLSAGRCQTPALKLVYENQMEINNAKGKQVYTSSGLFRISGKVVPFDHSKEFPDEDSLMEFYDQTEEFQHMFSCSSPKKIFREPPSPLNTSRIQQVASNELRYSPKETMRLCQKLYEGGHITYMRTDSKKYAKPFLSQTSSFIQKKYEKKYLANEESLRSLTSDQANPHEAIRPTNIYTSKLPESIGNKEARLYKLIRETTLQSCMSAAELYSIKGTITSPQGEYSRKCEQMSFPGWMIVGGTDKGNIDEKEYKLFSSTKPCQVNFTKICSKMTLKDLKQHYTEARLVHLLEEQGIGRPSTFSMLVDKIQEREYVKKQNVAGQKITCKDFELLENNDIEYTETSREFGNERNKLVIQPTGIIVMEFLEKHFSPLFQYEYTKIMEDNLDLIASHVDDINWVNVASDFYNQITELLGDLKTEKPEKIEYLIDTNHSYIIGKNGPVIKCTSGENVSFKPVKQDLDVRKLENCEYTLEEVIDTTAQAEYNLGCFEDHDIVLKKGRFGVYAKWGDENVSLKPLGNRPIESIRFEEVKEIIETTRNGTRNINDNLSIRTSKRGPYLFFKTKEMKRPKFFSLKDCSLEYMSCDLEELKEWIYEVHQVS